MILVFLPYPDWGRVSRTVQRSLTYPFNKGNAGHGRRRAPAQQVNCVRSQVQFLLSSPGLR